LRVEGDLGQLWKSLRFLIFFRKQGRGKSIWDLTGLLVWKASLVSGCPCVRDTLEGGIGGIDLVHYPATPTYHIIHFHIVRIKCPSPLQEISSKTEI
jgi:hypothetical protein